jgi:hypothetical protein
MSREENAQERASHEARSFHLGRNILRLTGFTAAS